MTEQAPRPTAHSPRRRPSLYRTVLSIGIAAIVAVWLPFSILYINALSKHAAAVNATTRTAAVSAGHGTTAVTPVTTRTS
jgi:uncharacterized membrane protein